MFKNVANFQDFLSRVELLRAPDYDERELPASPSSFFGDFFPWRVEEVLALRREFPEYHVVVCIEPQLYINAFVENALGYYLAEGDPDPSLIHDPFERLDRHFLQSLNSGRNRFSA